VSNVLNVVVPTEEAADLLGFQFYPGYHGAFTKNEVEGAWPNGARVIKAKSELGDSTPVGTLGTVGQ
jgi:hypothetical protein